MRIIQVLWSIFYLNGWGTARGIRIKSPNDSRPHRQIAKIYLPFYDGDDKSDDEYFEDNIPKVKAIVDLIVAKCGGVYTESELTLDNED